jgi:hypothetical protein
MASSQEASMPRSISGLAAAALTVAMGLTTAIPAAASDPPPSFVDSLVIAGGYHRELSLLPARYPDQPERAAYEFERLTIDALERQQTIELHPCFAEWWSYELMGLELMSLSHKLRTDPTEVNLEADAVERLGSRMWARAMSLVPTASEACGLQPRTPTPNMALTIAPAEGE